MDALAELDQDAQRIEREISNPRTRLFIMYYLECLNEGEAAQRAGYPRAEGKRLLQKPAIKGEIDKGLGLIHMSASEIIARLSTFARASMADFLDASGLIDLAKAKELQMLGVIKRLRYDSRGMPDIELEGRQEAMEKLGKILGMFIERMQIDSSQVIDINVNRRVMAAAMADPLTLRQLIAAAEMVKAAGGDVPVTAPVVDVVAVPEVVQDAGQDGAPGPVPGV